MTTTEVTRPARPYRADAGPPLVVLAGVSTALLLAGLIISTTLAGETFPSPYAAADLVESYFRNNSTAVAITGFFTFASGVPLAIYAATVSARLHNLGIRNPGATIALVGGIVASAFLCLSGLLGWVLSRPDVAGDAGVVHALQGLTFLTGGPGHVVLLGLLVAGIAVPGLLAGLLPRWVAVVGLVIAAVSELATLTLLVDGLMPLVPIGRFGGLLWLIAAAVLLPKRRPAANA
ncbi:DUF4386 domain-containing protein [Pseudonocardia sp. TRM90224]|uniref:DUF4386 domain-containing protein n=1 Tax=Pseudonocardia sp. TRM90224 TaxID=2812678 RepID=UPI001E36D565|nr:DUF4386 domain-containing protein [Pseudonocardia sp. TRM90224]